MAARGAIAGGFQVYLVVPPPKESLPAPLARRKGQPSAERTAALA